MSASLTFRTDSDLHKRLGELPAGVSQRVMVSALKAAAKPMQADMEALAAPRGQRFADPIAISDITRSASADDVDGDAVVAVGPTRGFFYGFEFGTINQPARPFVRPGFDRNVNRSLEIMRQHLWASIRKALPMGGASNVGSRNL